MINVTNGIQLEERNELEEWGRANSRSGVSLHRKYLQALGEEFSEGRLGDDEDPLIIPAELFAHAEGALGALAADYESLLGSGILKVSHMRRSRGAADQANGQEPVSVLAAGASMGVVLDLMQAVDGHQELAATGGLI